MTRIGRLDGVHLTVRFLLDLFLPHFAEIRLDIPLGRRVWLGFAAGCGPGICMVLSPLHGGVDAQIHLPRKQGPATDLLRIGFHFGGSLRLEGIPDGFGPMLLLGYERRIF